MRVFFDSSAFAKRFLEEAGSDEVEALCMRASDLGLSVICLPEIISAMNRRVRERSLSRRQYAVTKERLALDIGDADIIQLTTAVVARSVKMLEQNPLRAMDALHLACAAEWEADVFATSDLRQFNAAVAEGLHAVCV
ncbi:MAG: type II toxin-antitoxin system VapC family toxin [Kiritimatiellae bacterium]|nr:type II toxin-antitoxin system VapC family toxin [Kiritimatiellia bacterium]